MLQNGADLNIVGPSGKTVFWNAVHNSMCGDIDFVLSNNADLRITSNLHLDGEIPTTPFTQALLDKRKWGVATKLFHAGCSLNHVQDFLKAVERKPHVMNADTLDCMKLYLNNVGVLGQITKPKSLWNQARLGVLAGLGTGVVFEKMDKLGLPVVLANSLHYEKFNVLQGESHRTVDAL